jgi:hypothetical protein
LDGRVDEFGVWKRVLSAGERALLYNSGLGLAYPFNSAISYLPILVQPGWTTLELQDFEDNFPEHWDRTNYPDDEYRWGKRDCQVFAGSFGGWAVGGGNSGGSLPCGSEYPTERISWMTYGPFSLAGASDAEMLYRLWLNSEQSYDGLCAMASVNGDDFYGTCFTGNSNGWTSQNLDLTNIPDLGNLLGRSQVWVGFVFISDEIITLPGGAYLDDIVIRACFVSSCSGSQAAADDGFAAEAQVTTFPIEINRRDGQVPDRRPGGGR